MTTATGRPTPPSSTPRPWADHPVRSPKTWPNALRAEPPPHLRIVEVAGPGFVNFHLEPGWLHDALGDVVEQGEATYARSDIGAGEQVQIEFISANPTGPLHVGNGWWGAYGDAIGRVMDRCGWQRAARVLRQRHRRTDPCSRESLLARRRGDEVPEAGYQGEYVTELAARLRRHRRDRRGRVAGRRQRILDQIRSTLARPGHRLRRVVQPGLGGGERCGAPRRSNC